MAHIRFTDGLFFAPGDGELKQKLADFYNRPNINDALKTIPERLFAKPDHGLTHSQEVSARTTTDFVEPVLGDPYNLTKSVLDTISYLQHTKDSRFETHELESLGYIREELKTLIEQAKPSELRDTLVQLIHNRKSREEQERASPILSIFRDIGDVFKKHSELLIEAGKPFIQKDDNVPTDPEAMQLKARHLMIDSLTFALETAQKEGDFERTDAELIDTLISGLIALAAEPTVSHQVKLQLPSIFAEIRKTVEVAEKANNKTDEVQEVVDQLKEILPAQNISLNR